MKKIEKQLKALLSRAGVPAEKIDEAVATFEGRFRDYYGFEFQAIDDQGEYLTHNNEKLTPSLYVELLKAGKLGSDAEKKFFSNELANAVIRGSRGTVEDETGDMNETIRKLAGYE
jgi:hypothetical protein